MPSVLAGSGSGSAFFPQVSTASASVVSMLSMEIGRRRSMAKGGSDGTNEEDSILFSYLLKPP